MGYESEVWINQSQLFTKIKDIEEIYAKMSKSAVEEFKEWYPDMMINDIGEIEHNDYCRKNYLEPEEMIEFLKAIYELERCAISLEFLGEDGARWGYKIDSKGKLYELFIREEWKAIK